MKSPPDAHSQGNSIARPNTAYLPTALLPTKTGPQLPGRGCLVDLMKTQALLSPGLVQPSAGRVHHPSCESPLLLKILCDDHAHLIW